MLPLTPLVWLLTMPAVLWLLAVGVSCVSWIRRNSK